MSKGTVNTLPAAVTVMLRRRRDRVPVGLLRFGTDGPRQFSLFRYAPSWLESPDAFALAPDLPLEDRDFPHSGRGHGRAMRAALPGPVSDGTPDSWGRGILRTVLGGRQDEKTFLLAVGDATRQGALGYADNTPLFAGRLARTRRELGALRELAVAREQDRAGNMRAALAAAIGSLGGSRPKADFDDGGHLAIAKFTPVRARMPVARLEVATLDLARAAGLDAARLEFRHDERPVAIIRRFDRRDGAPVPYLSARSFLGPGMQDACYTDIAARLAAHGFEPERQMAELWRRLLFTILVSNTDDHLQNHGFLHVAGGRWALAPAFDIVPSRRRGLKTGIAPGYGKVASVEAALEAAPCFALGRDRARTMLRAMLEVVTDGWAAHCRARGMAARAIAACRPAFEHEQTAAARRLAAPGRKGGTIPDGKEHS